MDPSSVRAEFERTSAALDDAVARAARYNMRFNAEVLDRLARLSARDADAAASSAARVLQRARSTYARVQAFLGAHPAGAAPEPQDPAAQDVEALVRGGHDELFADVREFVDEVAGGRDGVEGHLRAMAQAEECERLCARVRRHLETLRSARQRNVRATVDRCSQELLLETEELRAMNAPQAAGLVAESERAAVDAVLREVAAARRDLDAAIERRWQRTNAEFDRALAAATSAHRP
eukprot:m51a1_g7296 hypothetical protein (236) ;mRNA; r:73241-74272